MIYMKIAGKSISDQKTYNINDNCGSFIKVTTKAIVITCPSYLGNTGRITVYAKVGSIDSGLDMIADLVGPYPGAMFGQDISCIES